jgi:hypothetical protein
MASVQADMAHALELTLNSGGQVACKVSPNIRQQQYERVAGYVKKDKEMGRKKKKEDHDLTSIPQAGLAN